MRREPATAPFDPSATFARMSADFVLRTRRFGLRPHRLEDVPFMVSLNSDPEVVRYTGDVPFERDEQAEQVIRSLMRQYEERKMGRFVVVDLETGERVGWCGLRWFPEERFVDLGYRLFRAHWGRGIATETGQACLDYGFGALGLERIVAYADADNVASVRVLGKLGFSRLGTSTALGPSTLFFERRRAG